MKIHKEGTATIIITLSVLFLVSFFSLYFFNFIGVFITLPFLLIFLLVLWFFRVPNRNIRDFTNEIIAPVDGKVVMIKEVEETEFLNQKCIQISIFMSPLNVHICRYPVNGKVIYNEYHPGKYLFAWNEKSSTENERTTLCIETETNDKIVFRQIAGYLARRIVKYSNIGDIAKAGEEFGFIKFGSRMDVFVPLNTKIICKIGDVTKGGLDIIAKLS